MPFFRAHIRPEDWMQLIAAIERHDCSAGCPARGYSSNPADYELEYAGLLVEAAIVNDVYDDAAAKPQVTFAVHGRRLGIYRAIPSR